MGIIKNSITRFCFILAALLSSFTLLAQEGGADIDVDINKDSGGTWYTQPWVWVVGGAIFILLLVALLRRNRARD